MREQKEKGELRGRTSGRRGQKGKEGCNHLRVLLTAVQLDVSSLLLNRMKSDLFWDEIRLRRIHGTLRERAPKDKVTVE